LAGELSFVDEGAKWCQVQELVPIDHVMRVIGVSGAVNRGPPFERIVVHSVHARYLIVSWRLEQEWVPLSDVLVGAVSKADRRKLKGVDVNLSNGVCCPDDPTYATANKCRLTWCVGKKTAHHDAYLWCRRRGREYPVPVQIRHGAEKSIGNLRKTLQTKQSKRKKDADIVGPLLVVNQNAHVLDDAGMVAVNATAMSNCDWLWLMTPGASGSPGCVST
jgi:hypothetical protein